MVDALESRARALGYQRELCEPCDGSGIYERPYLGGVDRKDPCPYCGGSGRMWSIRGQVPWLNDTEMRGKIGP